MASIGEIIGLQQHSSAERERLARVGECLLVERAARTALGESRDVDQIVRARVALQIARRALADAIAECEQTPQTKQTEQAGRSVNPT